MARPRRTAPTGDDPATWPDWLFRPPVSSTPNPTARATPEGQRRAAENLAAFTRWQAERAKWLTARGITPGAFRREAQRRAGAVSGN